MKSKNALTVILAALMVFGLAFSAEARAFGPAFSNREPGRALGALQTFLALKLTDVQQEQMKSIMAKYQDQGKDLRTKMREARRNTWAVLNAIPFNEENARNAFQNESTIREEMFILKAKMMAELKSVLTLEQMKLLKERKTPKFIATEHGLNAGPQNPSE